MRLALAAALLGAAACAQIEPVEPPEPPRLEGNVPAVGRDLDLDVEGRGTPVRLQGVTGRVTAVCVLGTGQGATPAPAPPPPEPPAPAAAEEAGTADANRVDAEENAPAAEAPPGRSLPPLAPAAREVLDACRAALADLRDRIAVVALTTDPELDLDRIPLRTFRDPGGKALGEKLDLQPVSQVIVADTRGRVAEVLSPAEAGRLRAAVERLVRW